MLALVISNVCPPRFAEVCFSVSSILVRIGFGITRFSWDRPNRKAVSDSLPPEMTAHHLATGVCEKTSSPEIRRQGAF